MQTTSETWKSLVVRGEFKMNVLARIYGAIGSDPNGIDGEDSVGKYKEYYTITAPTINIGALQNGTLTVGNCISGSMSVTVMTTDVIPKSARVVIRARVTDGKEDNPTYSEWLQFGTFWVDSRSTVDNLITLSCYDAMTRANSLYVEEIPVRTPFDLSIEYAQTIGAGGVTFKTLEYIENNGFFNTIIDLPADNDRTIRDVLAYIGGIMGVNWIISPTNMLDIVPVTPRPPERGYIVDNDYQFITSNNGDKLIYDYSTIAEHPYGGGTINVPVVIGGISTADEYAISKVTMSTDSDTVYEYGSTGGYVLNVEDNPLSSQQLCRHLYDMLVGVGYQPFTATGCVFDPATEIGDWVYVGDKVRSVIYNMTMTLGVDFRADISAPGENELESEYPYQKKKPYAGSSSNASGTNNQTQQRGYTGTMKDGDGNIHEFVNGIMIS